MFWVCQICDGKGVILGPHWREYYWWLEHEADPPNSPSPTEWWAEKGYPNGNWPAQFVDCRGCGGNGEINGGLSDESRTHNHFQDR